MLTFRYRALSATGAIVEGEMAAASAEAVVERLQALGHLPIQAVAQEAGARPRLSDLRLRRRVRIPLRSVATMTREFATLVDAELAIDRALEILVGVSEDRALRELLARVQARVRDGASLADALAAEGDALPRFYVSMVRAGEAGGSLAPVLARLAATLERSDEVRESIKSALIYPAILLFVVLCSLVVLLTVVLPSFRPLFEASGRSLPAATRVVVALGDGLAEHGHVAALALVAAALAMRWNLARPGFRLRFDRIALRVPLVGRLIAEAETARLARGFAALVTSGMQLPNALSIAAQAVGNAAMREALAGVVAAMREGKGLGGPLRHAAILPALAIHLVQVGEETGRLPEMLGKVADMFEVEVRRTIDRLLALLVPALTLLLGLIVAGVIASVLLAVLSVNELAF